MVAARVEPSEYQKLVLKKLSAAAGSEEQGKDATKRGKRKRPKGPNPLSVKRSTKMRLRGKLDMRGLSSKNKVCCCLILLCYSHAQRSTIVAQRSLCMPELS